MTPPNGALGVTLSSARRVLLFLFAINILNYVDRQILYAVLPLVKTDLSLSDTQLGALASAFMLVYMGAAPLIAYFSDRFGRVRFLAGGIFAWSASTFLSGASRTYAQLLLARASVGIGEASFVSISPSFVAEHFSPGARGRALAFFSMAIPVGSALGYVLGGAIGGHAGWRAAFLWAGLAGLPFGVAALWLADPRAGTAAAATGRAPARAVYLALFRNKSFVLSTLASAAFTFALGGLAVWMPTYFHREWNLSLVKAGTLFGGVTVVAGIAGSLSGGWIADRALRRTQKAYFLVTAVGLFASVPFGVAALLTHRFPLALAALGCSEFFVFFNNGPLNAVTTEVTPLASRTMAFAVNIFFIHALGDAISPVIIGAVSDHSNLTVGLLSTVGFLALAGAFCLAGMKFYESDARSVQERGMERSA